ncbi:MAG: phosphoribosyltransferase family protein [Elainellaceae cyanobacterium]
MASPPLFRDRTDAGLQLAAKLQTYADQAPVVLGLPRGGVPVAYEVALALNAPLDLCVVRKLGVPGQEELAMGAIAADLRYLNRAVVDQCRVSTAAIEQVTRQELHELQRREREYRGDHPVIALRDRTVILVDDGLATGATAIAAIGLLRRQSPKQIVVAVPVASWETCQRLIAQEVAVVTVEAPASMRAIGLWYMDFSQTTDDEVRDFLHRARLRERDMGIAL